jgi:hypothetical protein
MSTFEYLAIAFSLILSFAGMRIVEGLAAAAEVHLSFTSLHLVAILGLFWAFLAFRDVTWTFPSFVLVLLGPSLYYFVACTLMPRNPAEVVSWRDHFFSIRRRFWLALLFYALSVQAVATLLLDWSWTDPSRAPSGAMIVLSTAGTVFPSERAQAILAVASWLMLVLAVVAVGPLSRSAA